MFHDEGDLLRFEVAGQQSARAMLRDGECEEAVFVVCAPRAWTDLRASLARISTSLPGLNIDWLNAEDVLSLHRHSDTAHLTRRYDLRLE